MIEQDMHVQVTLSSHADSSDRSSLHEYVQQLRECLCGWDPTAAASGTTHGEAARDFVDALTEIAALPLDALSMEARRLLVDECEILCDTTAMTATTDTPVARILAALSARDVLLKCKAANALGSLCISRVAGQQLLDAYGDIVLTRLERMATCKNRWAQGDAFSVLGWIVVIADDAMLQRIAPLVPTVVTFLHRSVTQREPVRRTVDSSEDATNRQHRYPDARSTEDTSNVRVYALVLLLNCMQRDVQMVAPHQRTLLATLDAVVQQLVAHKLDESALSGITNVFETTEFIELLRLTITLLSLLVDQLIGIASLVLEAKMLPVLLRLRVVLVQTHAAGLLVGSDSSSSSNSSEQQSTDVDSDDAAASDLHARMAVIIDTIVASR